MGERQARGWEREVGREMAGTFDADGCDSFLAAFFHPLLPCPRAMMKNDPMYQAITTAWAAKMLFRVQGDTL